MQERRYSLPGARAATLLFQQSLRRVSPLPGIWKHHRFRFESGRSRSGQIAGRRRHRTMDKTTVPPALSGRQKMGARARNSDECAVAPAHRRTAAPDSRRRSRERLRRRQRVLHLAGTQKIQVTRARLPQPLPRLRDVPGLPGDSFAGRGSRGACGGKSDY